MSNCEETRSLEEVVDDVEDGLEEKPTLESVVYASGKQAYGPMLLVPALLAMGPTGAIPGLPTTCGVIMIVLSAQLISGRERPWIPKRLLRIRLDKGLVEKAINMGRPAVAWLSQHLCERWTAMLSRPVLIVAALAMVGLAGLMPFLELLPLAAAAPAAAIALIAIALTTRDGIVMTAGLTGSAAAAGFAVWLLSSAD